MRHIILFALTLPALACIPVEGDHITAKQLAQANSLFGGLDPNLQIGFSPRAGITRLVRAEEQAQLARKYGVTISGALADVCFIGEGEPAAAANKPANREVERGERVAVEVSSGAAVLTFQAEAASAGRTGDSVVVKNPENGRLFSAKVQSKGKVVVQR